MPIYDFSEERLPKIYKRNDKDCYLDPIREKLIYITPEETVRQQVISYLMDKLKVPLKMIRVEEHLSHYGVKSKNRADIIIEKYNEKDNMFNPLVVIECKAPSVMLDDNVIKQMVGYADELGCIYCMMTNGTDYSCYYYDSTENKYVEVEALPDYMGMIKSDYNELPDNEKPPRLTLKEIRENPKNLYAEIGRGTPDSIVIPAINIWECLLYDDHKFSAGNHGIFDVIEDYGVRLLSFGDASGGTFQGAYRTFIINYQESTEMISLGMTQYVTEANPDLERTCLQVAIDDGETSHNSLLLVLDDNLIVSGDICDFYHHGKISVGNIGSGKVSELREIVNERYPSIIQENKFYLGRLVNNKLWNLDDADVTKFIENIISYALIRDDYRKIVKDRKKNG